MKLQPAMVFGSHMVLQRQQPVVVWGRGAEGDRVTVTLGSDSAAAQVRAGQWQVSLPAREAETGLTMHIQSEKTAEALTFTDVSVGEVWLAGGQSNMEFPFKYDIEEPDIAPGANDPQLRFFDYPEVSYPGHYESGRFEDYGFWRSCTPEDVLWFSAVGYYFAAKLRQALGVPVGVIGCNWGGTPAITWIDRAEIESDPIFAPALAQYQAQLDELDWPRYEKMQQMQAAADPARKRAVEDVMLMGKDMSELWKTMEMPKTPPTEMVMMQLGPKSANAPGVLFDTMVRPLAPYGVRGVIWYQGESDDGNAGYDGYMRAVQRSWSKLWGAELPFYQVMLAPFGHWAHVTAGDYPGVRRLQKALADTDPHFFCANIMDSGTEDNIHPRMKRPAGERLALLALKNAYAQSVQADSPSMDSVQLEPGQVAVRWKNAAGGLHIRGGQLQALRVTVDGVPVEPVCTAEGDRLILKADAFQPGKQITLSFAEENYCVVNLYGGTGLPAFPFEAAL